MAPGPHRVPRSTTRHSQVRAPALRWGVARATCSPAVLEMYLADFADEDDGR